MVPITLEIKKIISLGFVKKKVCCQRARISPQFQKCSKRFRQRNFQRVESGPQQKCHTVAQLAVGLPKNGPKRAEGGAEGAHWSNSCWVRYLCCCWWASSKWCLEYRVIMSLAIVRDMRSRVAVCRYCRGVGGDGDSCG